MEQLGFSCLDIEIEEDYGSVEEAVATYGFIYRRTAIDHFRVKDEFPSQRSRFERGRGIGLLRCGR